MASSSVKAFLTSREVMVHCSVRVAMIPHPTNPLLPATPWKSKGKTFNVGRNAAKREARKALKQVPA